MYRDDPLAAEEELRAILGDDAVDTLIATPETDDGEPALDVAVDVLRLLQGWVADESAAGWFMTRQRRLDEQTPIETLASGDATAVRDAARRWAAAQS